MMTSLDDLLAAPMAPNRAADPERVFTSRLELRGDVADATVRGPISETDESTARALLLRKGENPDQWEVTGYRSSEWTMANGELGVSNRYSFVRIGTAAAGGLTLPNLDDLHAAAERTHRSIPKITSETINHTLVGVIADPQVGKTSERGGTPELLARLEASRENWTQELLLHKPHEVVLVDAGDAIENFENAGPQERTNDLQLTEQIRLWRRIFWSWVETAAAHAPLVRVVSVPSNHCSVRRGKAVLGTPNDDYGIEVLSQIADMASVHPEKYGHVSFYSPPEQQEAVALEALGGKVLGFAHGHQVGSPEKLGTWLAGQALGRTPIGGADICIFGHWHNLRIQTLGNDRWIFIAPTSDNGSSWFRNISGHESAPGILSFIVDEGGWRDLRVC